MGGPIIIDDPWKISSIRRRSYRSSVCVQLTDGTDIFIIPHHTVVLRDRLYRSDSGVIYLGMHKLVLSDLYDLIEEVAYD